MFLAVGVHDEAGGGPSFEELNDLLDRRGYNIHPGETGDGTFRVCNIGAIDASHIRGFMDPLRESLEQGAGE